jgi:protein involved in polysaccharide export with SLBB domain
VRLENGDIIVIPDRSDTVFVAGEVSSPGAHLWQRGLTLDDYIRRAGGFSQRGSSGTVFIRRPSGEVLIDGARAEIRPGDEIIVGPRLDPRYLQLGIDLTQVVFQTAVAARAFR